VVTVQFRLAFSGLGRRVALPSLMRLRADHSITFYNVGHIGQPLH
jgi:hypothetical protein